MSEENVEVVRRYFEAVERAFQAYWKDPRGAEAAVKAGEVAPEGVEMARYLHPNCEWKTLMAGITYRGFVGMASGFDSWWRRLRPTRSSSKRSMIWAGT